MTVKEFFESHLGIVTTIIVILLIMFLLIKLQDCNNHSNNFNTVKIDSVKVWRDKYNLEHAKVEVISSYKVKDFLDYEAHDSGTIKLQEQVKNLQSKLKAGSSVTYITNNTIVNASAKDSIIEFTKIGDTIYPTYAFKFDSLKNKWLYGKGTSNKDSTHLDLKIHNEYSLVIGWEKNKKLFKPKIPFAEVTNLNPNTETGTMRTYQVQVPKPKRLGLGFTVGYGVYFDPARLRFGSGVVGSVGLNYNLILIK